MDSRSIDFVINQKGKKRKFSLFDAELFLSELFCLLIFSTWSFLSFKILFTCDRVVRPKWDSNLVLEGTLLLLQRMLYLYWMWRPKLVGIHYRSLWHFLLYYFWIRPRMWCSCLVNSLRFCKQNGSKCCRRDKWSCWNPETPYPVSQLIGVISQNVCS